MIPAHSHSPNFSFLTRHHATLERAAIRAEQYFPEDPVTTWPR
jgi:hypothetical protein